MDKKGRVKDQLGEMMHLYYDEKLTYRQIAVQIGCSQTTVRRYIHDDTPSERIYEKIVYPAIKQWMTNGKIKYEKIAGISGYDVLTIKNQLWGRRDVRKDIIDTILKMSGRSYEEMFGRMSA